MIKIKSIEFVNHEFFGNRTFDFTIDGKAVNNIVLAGENGCGKTKLLEEINKFSSIISFHSSSRGTYGAKKITKMVLDVSEENYFSYESSGTTVQEQVAEVVLEIVELENGGQAYPCTFKCSTGGTTNYIIKENSKPQNAFEFNSIYSDVNINYEPLRRVDGVTKLMPDTVTRSSNLSTGDIAYRAAQLLVDIEHYDAIELSRLVREKMSNVEEKEIKIEIDTGVLSNSRRSRFTHAFNEMFDNKIQYKGTNNNLLPFFVKNNKEVEIYSLSSGEKQIVFRGAQLLENKESLRGAIAIVDEPELSMHPKWEDKIYDYYKNIFSDDKKQTSQLFFATHSEHVLENALDDDKCLILKFDGNSCKKFYKGSSGVTLPTITQAEIKYSIFNMYTTDFHIALYAYIHNNFVQGIYISDVDSWIQPQTSLLRDYYKPNNHTQMPDYRTLSTYIRNCIDHPDNIHNYDEQDLKDSIEDMIRIINNNR